MMSLETENGAKDFVFWTVMIFLCGVITGILL